MLIDKVSELNNYTQQRDVKLTKVQELRPDENIITKEEDYKNKKKPQEYSQEMKLDNKFFGFDEKGKSFFAKIETAKGGIIQYPTEDAIKLATHFKQSNDDLLS